MVASSVAAPVSLEGQIWERLTTIPTHLGVFIAATVEYVLDNMDHEVPLDTEPENFASEEALIASRIQHWLGCMLQYKKNERDRYTGTCEAYFAQLSEFIDELEKAICQLMAA